MEILMHMIDHQQNTTKGLIPVFGGPGEEKD